MKFAYLIPVAAALTLTAGPVLAQAYQNPGADGNPGAYISGANANKNFSGISQMDPDHLGNLTTSDKADMLERGRVMLRDLKKQIAEAKTDEERQALIKKKQDVEHAMIEVQQSN